MSVDSQPILRNLTASDIPDALQLSAEAGWNQTSDDWNLLIDLFPEGCFGIEVEGDLVSTATLFSYGRQLAWIGMVLTHSPFRGRGFAKRLLLETLRLADQLGIESVKLDATDQGQPLYEKLGFRAEQPVERWEREHESLKSNAETMATDTLPQDLLNEDATVFGVNRSALLRSLVQRSSPSVFGTSYALNRPGRTRHYLGPCVADSPDAARSVIENTLARADAKAWYWDLLPANANATSLARDLGFAPKRHLLRMVRGNDLRGNEGAIYALAGFELG